MAAGEQQYTVCLVWLSMKWDNKQTHVKVVCCKSSSSNYDVNLLCKELKSSGLLSTHTKHAVCTALSNVDSLAM